MEITKEELESKYKSMKNKDLCEELGISKPTLSSLLDRAGIEKKGKGNRDKSPRKTKIRIV